MGLEQTQKRHPATDKTRNRCWSVKIILQLQNHLRCTIWWVLEIRLVALLLLSLNCDDHRNIGNSFLAETGDDDLTNALENCQSHRVARLHSEKENKDQMFLEIQQRSPSRFSKQHFHNLIIFPPISYLRPFNQIVIILIPNRSITKVSILLKSTYTRLWKVKIGVLVRFCAVYRIRT